MTEIVDGEIRYSDVTKNANGGTELMVRQMVELIDPELLKGVQIIHSRLGELIPGMKHVIQIHDLPNDPMYDWMKNRRDLVEQIDKFVFVSDWQMQGFNWFQGIPYRKSVVIKNCIEPYYHDEPKPDDRINIIYHTTPHRGLNILVPVFEELCKYHDDIHLDVYSSFDIYGWPERNKPYEALFERCRNHPNITYHGFQPNSVVRESLKHSHIFAYPSIWPETSSIATIEALAAGNVVVCPNYAALPETCANFAHMYQWSEDTNEHANTFMNALNREINDQRQQIRVWGPQTQYFNTIYNRDNAKRAWEQLLRNLKE